MNSLIIVSILAAFAAVFVAVDSLLPGVHRLTASDLEIAAVKCNATLEEGKKITHFRPDGNMSCEFIKCVLIHFNLIKEINTSNTTVYVCNEQGTNDTFHKHWGFVPEHVAEEAIKQIQERVCAILLGSPECKSHREALKIIMKILHIHVFPRVNIPDLECKTAFMTFQKYIEGKTVSKLLNLTTLI